MESLPAFNPVGYGPESKKPALLMASGDEVLQLCPFRIREGSSPTPLEVVGPLVTDKGNQVSRGLLAEISGASIE